MSEMQRFGVIMAGGAGERFWPLSRKARPKQLLCLSDPARPMLQVAVDLLLPMLPGERIFVITGKDLVEPIQAAQVGVPDANIVAEPCKRNTSGALAYITAHILATHPEYSPDEVSLAITTADHAIGDQEAFRRTILTALSAAETRNALVVCGIPPTRPATGFGYIQAGDPVALVGPVSDRTYGDGAVRHVHAFHEKPSPERAQDFLDAGNYFWNSGMFFWKASAFLEELDRVRPGLSAAVREVSTALRSGDVNRATETFARLEDISIDYALMEHARNVLVVPGSFPWDDVGSWPSLEAVLAHDAQGNATAGDPLLHQCEDCIVYNEIGAEAMAIGVIGARGLVVVATRDAVLVVPKERAQDVRHIVAELKRRGLPQA